MTKPARTFIARAEPYGPRWRAVFAFPGAFPDFVRGSDGDPRVFDSEATAEFVAMRTCLAAANARPRWTWKNVHRRMSADEFAAALAEAGISATDFALLWGTRHDRVMAWISGDEDVPFPMCWVLPLLTEAGAKTAMEIASNNTRRTDL